MANSVHPDQRPYSAVSDLCLHCLQRLLSVQIIRVITVPKVFLILPCLSANCNRLKNENNLENSIIIPVSSINKCHQAFTKINLIMPGLL